MRFCFATPVAAALILVSIESAAQEQPVPPMAIPQNHRQDYRPIQARRTTPKMKTVWYGWQTIYGLIGSDIITILGLYGDEVHGNFEPVYYLGMAGHVLSGPIVHWSHGHVGNGFISLLGLNIAAPAAGAGLGYLLTNSFSNGVYGARFVGGIGYIVGPMLDIALLSTEEIPAKQTAPKGSQLLLPSSVSVMPMLDQNRRGLMLVGQF